MVLEIQQTSPITKPYETSIEPQTPCKQGRFSVPLQKAIEQMEKDLDLFRKLAEKLFDAEITDPVVDPIPASELHKELDLKLGVDPVSDDYFEKTVEQLILQTPRTATKRFFNQLFGGRQSKATLGDLLAVLLNNSMYTYKVAGPQVGVEKEILHQICNLIGYGKASDGTFAPGGSMSNFMAILMARDASNLDI